MALAVAVALWQIQSGKFHTFVHHSLIILMGIAPAIAAAVGGYAEKMVFSAQAKRYEWTGALFARASRQMLALIEDGKLDEVHKLIRELGEEALEEHGDWVIVHRERTPEVRP